MSTVGKIVVRVVLVICILLVLLTDFSGIVYKIIGGSRTEGATNLPPRPTNPGYGDPKTDIDIDADIEDDSLQHLGIQFGNGDNSAESKCDRKFLGSPTTKSQILQTIKNACLPKLICELTATPQKDKLTDSEKSLLTLLKDTSISTTAELTSKYHFAAHMGQLIAGIEGHGCHNFYPTCPFPGIQVLQMMKKVRMR